MSQSAPAGTSGATVDIGDLLDRGRLGGYQCLPVALTALAIVFDGIDNQLMGVALALVPRHVPGRGRLDRER